MKRVSQPRRVGQMPAWSVLGAVWLLAGWQARADDWSGDLQAGSGYWAGKATYSIGGVEWNPVSGATRFPDKISELRFPLGVPYVSLGGALRWHERLEIQGTVTANVTDPFDHRFSLTSVDGAVAVGYVF